MILHPKDAADLAQAYPAFVGDDQPDGLDDLLVVTAYGGWVHRWTCVKVGGGSGTYRWTREMAGLDDRACPECLPGGLP